MKKIVSMLIVLILVLPVNLIGYAASDTTPPKLLNASINLKEAKVGDVVKITFELAPDLESGLNEDGQSGQIRLRHSSGTSINAVNQYIGNNKYEFKWTIDSDMLNGKWFVESVQFADNDLNYSSYHYQDDAILKDLYFNVNGGAVEPVKPVLKGITIQTPESSPGHAIRVDLDITDPSEEVYSGGVSFKHKITGSTISADFRKKQNGKGWEATAALPSNIKNGDWYIDHISINTKNFSSLYLSPEKYSFLKYKKFSVSGGINDFSVPIFHSVNFSKSIIQPGDSFDVYVDAEDIGTGIEKVGIVIHNKLTGHYISDPDVWDYQDGKYKMTVKIPIGQMPGQYEIKQVYLKDKAENDVFIMPNGNRKLPELTVSSIFSGTDGDFNSILTGSNFVPLQNVKAISNYEGDLTNDITYTGNVDTQTKGVYLVTYSVKSKQQSFTYKDYRWVSVNDENTLDNSTGISTAYFKSNIDVVVPSGLNVSLKTGSKSSGINGKAHVTSEGEYTATINTSQTSAQARALSTNGPSQTSQFKFVIDRTVPTTMVDHVTSVSTSVTGVTEPKAKLEMIINDKTYVGKANSTGKYSIAIPKQKVNTKYTIQSKDLAGNESKVISNKVILPLTLKPVSNLSTSIYGQTTPYSIVKLYISGKYVKQTKVNSKGDYKFTIAKQSSGREVKVVVITKEASTFTKTKVSDKIAPTLQRIDQVTSNSTYVTGKTEKYAKIRVDWMEYQGIIAEGKALSNGAFKVKIQKLKKGSTLRIFTIDAAGNESYRIIKVK